MESSQLLIPLLLFVATASICGAGGWWFLSGMSDERARLRAVTRGKRKEPARNDDGPLTDGPVHPTVERVARVVRKSPKETGKLRQRLVATGYRQPSAVVVFTFIEITTAVMVTFSLMVILGPTGILSALAGGGAGFMAPRIVLAKVMSRRQRAIQHGLPDALDLLTICLEAGCTLNQAIMRAADQLKLPHPALAEELAVVRAEIQAGRAKADVLRGFADRTQVDDVRSLVAMLLQTDRFGTSVAQALRTHGETLRRNRRLHAEERAAKAGVKLVFPLVFCFFPGFYVVVLGPSIIQFARVFLEDLQMLR